MRYSTAFSASSLRQYRVFCSESHLCQGISLNLSPCRGISCLCTPPSHYWRLATVAAARQRMSLRVHATPRGYWDSNPGPLAQETDTTPWLHWSLQIVQRAECPWLFNGVLGSQSFRLHPSQGRARFKTASIHSVGVQLDFTPGVWVSHLGTFGKRTER